jgi:hypothetical protein
VGRGATLTLLAIPAAIVVFAVVAGVFQIISGIVAVVIPYLAAWLYKKGAGAPLTRAGWAPFMGITAVAILIGTFVGIVAATYAGYLGNGGPLSAPFLRTLGNQFTTNLGDTAIPILIGIGLGAIGIVGVIRGPRGKAATTAPSAAATPTAAPTIPAPPAPNQPSPGVLLNGKPMDPRQK